MELYKRHRPKKLSEVIGQPQAVSSLQKLIEKDSIPHAILLSGPSGCGKTTIARILRRILKCSEQDFFERNAADFRGIDDIREIRRHIDFRPLGGTVRMFLIDECHKLTNDAQNVLLKMLEDTPGHAYFILATTDTHKLLKTIITRCSQIKLEAMGAGELSALVADVAKKEGYTIPEDVQDGIVEAADGSARKALVILEQVGVLENPKDQLRAIVASSYDKKETIELCRALMNPRGGAWGEVAKILRGLTEQDPEQIRYAVLGYARGCLLGKEGSAPNPKFAERAYMVIDIFSRNFYDSKAAGLAAACWEVMNPN